jgi:hypothetical protein
MSRAGFSYAQARMQARRAAAPTDHDWQLAEHSSDFGHCLDLFARTSLSGATSRISRDASPQRIETILREEWGAAVREVAAWLPRRWQAPVHWIAPLPYLRSLVSDPEDKSPLARLWAEHGDPQDDPATRWRTAFATRLGSRKTAQRIEAALPRLFQRYLGSQDPAATDDLGTVLRNSPQTPEAMFAYLGLIACDFERARGALCVAALFASSTEAA